MPEPRKIDLEFRELKAKLEADGWWERDPIEEAKLLIPILAMAIWGASSPAPCCVCVCVMIRVMIRRGCVSGVVVVSGGDGGGRSGILRLEDGGFICKNELPRVF